MPENINNVTLNGKNKKIDSTRNDDKKFKCKSYFNKNNNYVEFIRRNISYPSIGIMLFVLFIMIQPQLALLENINVYLYLGFISFAFILTKISNFKEIFIFKFSKLDILWFLAYVTIITYIILIGVANNLLYIFIYTSGLIFIILNKNIIDQYKYAIQLMMFGAVIYALGSILQYLFTDYFNLLVYQNSTEYIQAEISKLVQLNYYSGFVPGKPATAAGYMLVGLGLLLFFGENKNRLALSKNVFFFIVLFMGLYLTGKRSIIIWTIVALSFTYVVSGPRRTWLKRCLRVICYAIIISILFLIVLLIFGDVPFKDRFALLFNDLLTGNASGSVQVRLMLYKAAWDLFLENPIFGVGWEQYRLLTAGLHTVDYTARINVHNVYLQLLSEMGIVGFSIIVMVFYYNYIITFKALGRVSHQTVKNIDEMWEKGLTFSLYYQSFFLLYCFTENPFYHLTFVLTYFWAISIVGSYLVIMEKKFINFKL